MKIKSILFTFFAAACLCFSSCSEDEVADKLTGGCLDFYEEYDSVLATSTAFSENPTKENCEAYKQAWITFFESYKSCDYWTDGNYEETLNEIKSMNCDDL